MIKQKRVLTLSRPCAIILQSFRLRSTPRPASSFFSIVERRSARKALNHLVSLGILEKNKFDYSITEYGKSVPYEIGGI